MVWCVLQTRTLHEQFVASRIVEPTFLPTYLREYSHSRRIERRLLPLFPTYLFVWLDLTRDGWQRILNVRGVKGLLGKPTPVDDEVVDTIRENCGDQTFVPGVTKLKVVGGAWDGIEGLFGGNDGDRVKVLLNLMGRQVTKEVSKYSVIRV